MDVDQLILVQGQLSTPFVIISMLFAMVGVYTAFIIMQRINDNSFFPQSVWILLSAFAISFGIWSMHYMGMIAFEIPLDVTYNPYYTIGSFMPLYFCSYFALFYSIKKKHSKIVALYTSGLLATGVVTMHILGMKSLPSELMHVYNPIFLLLAFVLSFIAFLVYYFARQSLHYYRIKLAACIIIGGLFTLTHYSAMWGMDLYVEPSLELLDEVVPIPSRIFIASVLTTVFGVILLFLLVSSFADKYVQYRAENYDVLTKLPNIRMFEQTLEENIHSYIAIIQLKDLHKFAENTTYFERENIIKELATRIEQYKTPQSELFRTDYYQFVVLSKSSDHNFDRNMKYIQRALNRRYRSSFNRVFVPPFVILVVKKDNKTKLDVLFDRLNSYAKTVEFDREVLYFDDEFNKKTIEEEILESIEHALVKKELYLMYQPKIDIKSGKFDSVEALIRWEHGQLGFISPGVFIPILEYTSYIYDVTDWVIDEVCQQLKLWEKEGIGIDSVSINIPGTYVGSERLKKKLIDSVTKYQIRPSQLELEITETSYVDNIEEAIQSVGQLHSLGFSVAIDDFGTGLSSLSYLKQLMINTLKIDKSFIDGIPYSKKDSEIMKGIISLAKSLKLEIVIEGVEKEEQVSYLNDHFTDLLVQGFYYSKPLRNTDLVKYYLSLHDENISLPST